MKKIIFMLFFVALIFVIGCAEQTGKLPDKTTQKTTDKTTGNSVNEKIVLSLPFAENDLPGYQPDSMIPLGETVSHGDGEAHTGIDFHWTKKVSIIAVSEGIVTFIGKGESRPIAAGAKKDTWDVSVKTGRYLNMYTELDYVNPQLAVGKKIQRGDFIGYPWHQYDAQPDFVLDRYKIHWNFGYDAESQYPEPRLCPMIYFDNESKILIEEIWNNNRWEHKKQFPNICNGDYGDD